MAVAAPGKGGGVITGKGGGFAVGAGGGGGGGTNGETPGSGGGTASTGVSGNTTSGYFPSKLGSNARMRSINGGWVANPKNRLFRPFAKKRWLASSARCDWICDPSAMPPIFFKAPAKPNGLRVN